MKPMIEEKLNEIEIPKNLHERCMAGAMRAKSEMEERKMNKNWMKKTVAAAAIVLVCAVAIGNTTFADNMKGFFKDVIRWDGAVIGSEYVNATDEVNMKVGEVILTEAEVMIPVELTFLNAKAVPFSELELVEVDVFRILNQDGEIVVNIDEADVVSSIIDGTVSLSLSVEAGKISREETYTLVMEEFAGLKKADDPLALKGDWKCVFGVQ